MNRLRILVSSLILLVPSLVAAAPRYVTGIEVTNHNGQTFVTWDNLPGVNWTYRVYAASDSISDYTKMTDEDSWVGSVGDSSAVDKRLSSLLGTTLTFRTDASQPFLQPSRGLFVVTPPNPRNRWYAVTAESAGRGEQTIIVPGANTFTRAVFEPVVTPEPIFQRYVTSPISFEDRVLFTSNVEREDFPAMCSKMGFATHVAVIRGLPGRPFTINGHGRGGSMINAIMTSGHQGDWAMAIDEYLPNDDVASFYLGYTPWYDITSNTNNFTPSYGWVERYSEKRVIFLMDWAKRTMDYDPMRVYAQGGSMGGSFAYFLAAHYPERIAAAISLIPKLVFDYQPEPPYDLRPSLNRMWGTLTENLPLDNGVPVFDWMDACKQAQVNAATSSVPVFVFAGRNDNVVGWPEKIAFGQAMQQNRLGGALYWDTRDHYLPNAITPWRPTQCFEMVYPYRLDRSFPALSRCSADGFMGDGSAASGDSMGTYNGFVQWDTTIVDRPDLWEVTLRLKDLPYRFGTFVAPPSATVDVTPRRLQQFLVSTRSTYQFRVQDLSDGTILQYGVVTPDSLGLLTIPQVRVLKSAVRVMVMPTSVAGVDDPVLTGLRAPRFSLSRHPVRTESRLSVAWPSRGDASIEVFDATGRRMQTVFRGEASGVQDYRLSSDGFAPGVYVLLARQGGTRTSQRLVFVR